MQILAKLKTILYMGFRATLNFRKFENLYGEYTTGLENLTC